MDLGNRIEIGTLGSVCRCATLSAPSSNSGRSVAFTQNYLIDTQERMIWNFIILDLLWPEKLMQQSHQDQHLKEWISTSGLASEPEAPLFLTLCHSQLTGRIPLHQVNVHLMI